MALLRGMAAAGYRRLVVCHLNHRLRGRVAAADARFVRKTAEDLGLRFDTGEADVRALAASRGISLEQAGREARHAYFGRCAARYRCHSIFLAHHADDQVETVLLNLCRGAGGLRGMNEVTEMPVPGLRRPLQLIRPLLNVPKADLLAAAAAHGWTFREDASNHSAAFARNRFRNEVLPLLSAILRRDVRPAILRALELSRDADDYLEAAAAPLAGAARLRVADLRQQAPALRRRVISRWLRLQGVPGVSRDLTDRVAAMLDPESGPSRQELPGSRLVRRRQGWLWIESP